MKKHNASIYRLQFWFLPCCFLFITISANSQELFYDSIAANIIKLANTQIRGVVDCNDKNAVTTASMRRCAHLAFEKSHRNLEKEIEAIQAFLVEKQKAEQRWLFITSQNHWMQFRNQHCSIYWRQYQGGSLQPLIFTDCLTRLTDKRLEEITEIKELILFR